MEKFSYYRKPITNLIPYREITLVELYQVVRGDYYKVRTERLRNATPDQYKKLKASELDYITPGGTFTKRESKSIIKPSGLISIDIDHIDNPEEVKATLSSYDGMRLIFTSPSGKGVKAILTDPQTQDTYTQEFEAIKERIKKYYGLIADNTSDIARACFVCHDPNVWISKEVRVAMMVKKNPHVSELVNRFDLILN